jgi:DNA-binding MarR family transcriptional regulator
VTRKKKKAIAAATAAEIETLMQQIMGAFRDLRGAGPRLGLIPDWSMGSWDLLQALSDGPVTMSDLARRRSVSRQYIQKIASVPIRKGWIRLDPNPADRRAPLMVITAEGELHIQTHRERVDRALHTLSEHFVAEDVAKAAATVALLRTVLEAVQRSAEPRPGE